MSVTLEDLYPIEARQNLCCEDLIALNDAASCEGSTRTMSNMVKQLLYPKERGGRLDNINEGCECDCPVV